MDEPTSEIWLVRHGETPWSRDWLHTSVTDAPLTERGIEQARALGTRLAGHSFSLVLTSPRSRSRDTAELAGFPDAVVEDDLSEWGYGRYELAGGLIIWRGRIQTWRATASTSPRSP